VDYVDSLLDLVGNTPLVRLRSVTAGLAPTVLAKVEYFKPGWFGEGTASPPA